jgi:uncharacterized protein (TIGR02646 family)
MTPYRLSSLESQIITTLQNKTLSSKEMWEDESVTEIKSRIKKHYISQQNQTCAYCKVDLHTNHGMVWDAEHIIDKDSSSQWIFEPLNLCISCKACNQSKSTKNVTKSASYKSFPKKAANYRIVHAHFDNYEEHIEVAVPGVTYRYKSEKGRETIEVCGLLRYHEVGGRKDIDPILQAVLNYAGDNQSPEALQAALSYLSSQLAKK